MEKSIVQIDVSILDKEIEALKLELQKKTELKTYILSLAKTTVPAQTVQQPAKATAPVKTVTQKPVETKAAPKQAPVKTVTQKPQLTKAAPKQTPAKVAPKPPAASSQPKGLTEFILDYLKRNPKSESKAVMTGFVNATGKKPEDVKANVANTLSRLLREKKVKKQEGEGLGYLWSLK